jgi:cytochrome c oxidase subunit 2
MNAAFRSVLNPAGPQAAHISSLWWLMFWVSAAVFVIVFGLAMAAMARGRRPAEQNVDVRSEAHLTLAVAIGVGVTVVTLFGLLAATMAAHRAILSLGAESALTINVTGHQFWWEIEYDDAVPSRRVTTANEIHIPVGRPVVLKVTSRDVIHSFWAPNLTGKRDLVPGIMSAIWLQADRPAVYRGQCAEFCGKQHAHMAFEIVAEPDAQFERWLDAQRATAPPPPSQAAARGQTVFMSAQCVLCHTVRGTPAAGRVGPDLTHVGTRGKIASATLPTDAADVAAWIRDPQHYKPGSQMPPTRLTDADTQALSEYLVNLK